MRLDYDKVTYGGTQERVGQHQRLDFMCCLPVQAKEPQEDVPNERCDFFRIGKEAQPSVSGNIHGNLDCHIGTQRHYHESYLLPNFGREMQVQTTQRCMSFFRSPKELTSTVKGSWLVQRTLFHNQSLLTVIYYQAFSNKL